MMEGRTIEMKMRDGAQISVYHVEAKGARRGGVVLIQEIFGITKHIKEMCNRFAAEGYEVLAPSLFDREAPGFVVGYSKEEMQRGAKLAREQHPFDLSWQDACACVDALRDKGPVFMVGYCYGGSVVWAAACKCDGLAAASAYYGSKIPELTDWQPKCPTICHFGEHDEGIPLEGVKKAQAARPDVPIYIYDAGHGFNSDREDHHNEPAAQLAWQRTLEVFRANGG